MRRLGRSAKALHKVISKQTIVEFKGLALHTVERIMSGDMATRTVRNLRMGIAIQRQRMAQGITKCGCVVRWHEPAGNLVWANARL